MDKTTLKQLKPGTLFRLKDSESSPVWVIGLLKLMLAINTKTTIMKLSSKYSLILHIRHYEHQKPIQQIS